MDIQDDGLDSSGPTDAAWEPMMPSASASRASRVIDRWAFGLSLIVWRGKPPLNRKPYMPRSVSAGSPQRGGDHYLAAYCHVLTELPQRAADAENLLPFNFGARAHHNTS
ncbi:hypothetical protein [Mesorhizobium sp. M0195]|uniref:hypothetical protein n=1 Tax=unclassified Mesorhizobium TaxID=325217 RepID=UPI003339CDFC